MIPEVLAQVRTTFPRIGPLQPPSTLEELVRYIFIVTVIILGLLIFWRLIRAGISWMLAGEESQKIQLAKSMIWDAFFGALIILSAWIFLNAISPHFTQVSVPVEPPRKVPKLEIVAQQKGVAFCKSNCARDNVDCIEENCIVFTGGSLDIKKLINESYNYLIGYGDSGEGKKNYAIFFGKKEGEFSFSEVTIWLEEFEREKQLDLKKMESGCVNSYNTSDENEIEVTLCKRTNLEEGQKSFKKFCKVFSTQGKALRLGNITGCKSETGENVCDYVREIRIKGQGDIVLTQENNFNGHALFLKGPNSFTVGGLAPSGVWAKEDKCSTLSGEEIDCPKTDQPGIHYLPPYIPVKSLLLIPGS